MIQNRKFLLEINKIDFENFEHISLGIFRYLFEISIWQFNAKQVQISNNSAIKICFSIII